MLHDSRPHCNPFDSTELFPLRIAWKEKMKRVNEPSCKPNTFSIDLIRCTLTLNLNYCILHRRCFRASRLVQFFLYLKREFICIRLGLSLRLVQQRSVKLPEYIIDYNTYVYENGLLVQRILHTIRSARAQYTREYMYCPGTVYIRKNVSIKVIVFE